MIMAEWYDNLPLGQVSPEITQYDAGLLRAVDRVVVRGNENEIAGKYSIFGCDRWVCYEVSWLEPENIPKVGVLNIEVDARSKRIIESKSLKLYLNGLNFKSFASRQSLITTIIKDLSAITGAGMVQVVLLSVEDESLMLKAVSSEWECLPDVPYNQATEYFERFDDFLDGNANRSLQKYYSHMFRSVCPVTRQPDWASVFIEYDGYALDKLHLAKFITSFRQAADFHETVVEKIVKHLMGIANTASVTVEARFLRRGGVEINPFRSTLRDKPSLTHRLLRQ